MNDFADVEIDVYWSIVPSSALEFAKASDDGDDVFLCEYEYDVNWHILKPLAELADGDCENDHVRKEEEEQYKELEEMKKGLGWEETK